MRAKRHWKDTITQAPLEDISRLRQGMAPKTSPASSSRQLSKVDLLRQRLKQLRGKYAQLISKTQTPPVDNN